MRGRWHRAPSPWHLASLPPARRHLGRNNPIKCVEWRLPTARGSSPTFSRRLSLKLLMTASSSLRLSLTLLMSCCARRCRASTLASSKAKYWAAWPSSAGSAPGHGATSCASALGPNTAPTRQGHGDTLCPGWSH